MGKQSSLDRAIAQLETERAALDLALDRLRRQRPVPRQTDSRGGSSDYLADAVRLTALQARQAVGQVAPAPLDLALDRLRRQRPVPALQIGCTPGDRSSVGTDPLATEKTEETERAK